MLPWLSLQMLESYTWLISTADHASYLPDDRRSTLAPKLSLNLGLSQIVRRVKRRDHITEERNITAYAMMGSSVAPALSVPAGVLMAMLQTRRRCCFCWNYRNHCYFAWMEDAEESDRLLNGSSRTDVLVSPFGAPDAQNLNRANRCIVHDVSRSTYTQWISVWAVSLDLVLCLV